MIFALLLFGCADDGSQCEQLAAPPRHYEAKVLCEADAELALQSEVALRADYPMVEARCQPVGADASVALSTGDPAEGLPVASIRLAVAQPRPR
ncbi:MAG: hypothetical protein JF595_13985 [Sphingomonadales bacterium]|nr:hypothetical protein [Sphingomonadales bacterium]